jgi:4-alpha-glucanotransferase
MKDLPSAIREKRLQHWRQPVEPVTVVWGNELLKLELQLPASLEKFLIRAVLELETGEHREIVWQADRSLITASAEIEKEQFIALRLYYPERLPPGYHNITLEFPHGTASSLIISAPLQAYCPADEEKIWGVFLPLYALHTGRSWGTGNLSDFEALLKWTAKAGGRLAGTLPLLSSFFDKKYGPGPYMPASKLFWNELYLDISSVPGLTDCPAAQSLINSADFQRATSGLRASPRVEYNRDLALKRTVLEELAGCFFDHQVEQPPGFRHFMENNRSLDDYASFRAAGEQHGLDWHRWPFEMRDGVLQSGNYQEKNKRYHLYTSGWPSSR